MLCGGTTEAVVDERVKEVAMKMKGEVEKQANESFSTFEPVEAMTQVVAGTNYFIKVDVGNGKAVFMRVWDHFGDLSLTSIQTGKTLGDKLEYF
ncbi:cystatin-B [Blastocystis sp. ATCC 50177/Nand II]|uniref:Cystatin-B n=1 Tax=Blastocystis sp. subtype 1 (strain ATCC 50177 / NandII) TaxID=478820 RepID=A0A196SAK3_BLAHN|nr:cystatin-B [Blastocystis sp. ATCC 50177/Nand II]